MQAICFRSFGKFLKRRPIARFYCQPKNQPLCLHSLIKSELEAAQIAAGYLDSPKVGSTPVRQGNQGSDYECQVAIKLSQDPNIKQTPLEIANTICKNLKKNDVIEEATVSAHSWISIKVRDSFLFSRGTNASYLTRAMSEPDKYQNVLIDYASPNMSKELHVGHLRSTMIGACLSSVFKHKGYSLTEVSHVGDFGTPMGLVVTQSIHLNLPFVQAIKQNKPVSSSQYPTPSELSQIYVQSKKHATEDKEFERESKKILLEIQQPSYIENESKKIWRVILAASRVGFEECYSKLGVSVPEKGESAYVDLIPPVLHELKEKGLLTESEGALVCSVPGYKAPLMVKTADDTYLYAASDLAALKYRINEGYKRVLYVTDASQRVHFSQLFQIGLSAGWYKEDQIKFEHVGFGLVTDQNGQKLSSRDGTPIPLATLLNDAVPATKQALIAHKSFLRAEKKNTELDSKTRLNEFTPEEAIDWKNEPDRIGSSSTIESSIDEKSADMAYNAIIYYELSNTRKTGYKFSFGAMLNMRSNTAIYLLYAYARIRSIFSRASESGTTICSLETDLNFDEMSQTDIQNTNIELTTLERNLLLKLLQFPESIDRVIATLEPNQLCSYLYELAKSFNQFYEQCRILGSPHEKQRLLICLAVQHLLSYGLTLLNVKTLEKI